MYLRPLLHSLRRAPGATKGAHLFPIHPSAVHRTPQTPAVASAPALVRFASSDSSTTPTTAQPAEHIYYGTLTPKIRAVKVFSLTTSAVGVTIQPMLIEQGSKLGGMPMVVFMCGFAGLFTFVTPLLLHFVTKKYVTQIAYDAARDEYTATTISFFLLRKQVSGLIASSHVSDTF